MPCSSRLQEAFCSIVPTLIETAKAGLGICGLRPARPTKVWRVRARHFQEASSQYRTVNRHACVTGPAIVGIQLDVCTP